MILVLAGLPRPRVQVSLGDPFIARADLFYPDQKLVIDNLTNDVRVIREKLDDNNVRIGSLTQELDSLRQSSEAAVGRSRAAGANQRSVVEPSGDNCSDRMA